MKLFHLSDLHLGKLVHEFSMIEDQEYILLRILEMADRQRPQAVLISGDVFDKSIATTEALRLLDDFLDGLVRRDIEVFIISGNHDSADRLAFGSRLMERSGVHIARPYGGSMQCFVREDAHGKLNIWMLPFVKPAHVKRFHPEKDIANWTDAVRTAIAGATVDASERNILLSHQFVTGASTCESEELHVGGTDNVDADVFAPFDYVALGHLHGPQRVSRDTIRYCGTPLKYSFSECTHKKSITVIECGEKGDLTIDTLPLVPKRDMRKIRGTYMELTSHETYKDQNTDDYIHVTLTDEEDQPDAIRKLRVIYPNIMRLEYDNCRTRAEGQDADMGDARQQSPVELFDMFFAAQNGKPLSDIQRAHVETLIEHVWEDAR